MDTKLATTKVRLESWTNIIRERSASGQNVKVWCKENNIPEGQYYYWLRRVKEAALTASGSRTVEICMPGQESSVTEPVTTSDHAATSAEYSCGLPGYAHGTAAVTTPCSGQCIRWVSASISTRIPPKSRPRHTFLFFTGRS